MTRDIWLPSSDLSSDLGTDQHLLESLAEDVAIERARLITQAFCHMAAIRSLYPSSQLA
ncbi:MAG: hypothetical protein KDB03_08155 [Planctomycetales bacterium]|nr:hypothetical protein [Planctomycetales bacterium]